MFGIDTKAIKQAYQAFEQETAALSAPADPWVAALVMLIQAIGKAFGD